MPTITVNRSNTLTQQIRDRATKSAVASTPAEVGLLRSSASDILGLNAQATVDAANAKAEQISAAGYQREAEAYGVVGEIADQNATLAGIAGGIKQLQTQRAVTRTIGAQKAGIAAAGFGNAGSSLDLLRSSLQEGYLSDQLIRTQTSLTQGGYLEESAAARAQGAGATMASDAAMELSKQHATAGALSTANAANQTAALIAYMEMTQGGAALTPEQELTLGTLSGDPSVAAVLGQNAGSDDPSVTMPTAEEIRTRTAGPRYRVSSAYMNNPAGPAPTGTAPAPYVDTWR